MRRFKSILLYANETSDSDSALRRAEALAAKNEASLHVVDVLPEPGGLWRTAAGQSELQEAIVTARVRQLDFLVAPAVQRGVDVTVRVLTGRPCVEIIREVLRERHDLVLVHADAEESRPGHPLKGTAVHLLRDCPCPVWVSKRGECGRHGRILAAVDAGEDWSEHQRESLRTIEIAASVAESDGSELRIVYCLGHWSSNSAARWPKNGLGRYRRRLDGLLAKCQGSRERCEAHLEENPAAEVLDALCDEVDVLVMGTVWRSGPAGVLIADAATDALARVDCSVVAVKPEGFIAPFDSAGGRLSHAA